MSFQSSVRFGRERDLTRRVRTECSPRANSQREERRGVQRGVRMKLVHIDEDRCNNNYTPKKRAYSYMKNHSQMQEHYSSLKIDLQKIRKEIKRKSDIFDNRTVRKHTREITLQPVNPQFSQRQILKPVWYCQPPMHQQKRQIFKLKALHSPMAPRTLKIDYKSETQSQEMMMDLPLMPNQKLQKRQSKQSRINIRLSTQDITAQNKFQHFGFTKRQEQQKQLRRQTRLRSFRKIGNAVLFTIYLRTFNQRMRLRRKTAFDKYIQFHLADKLLQLKKILLSHSEPILKTIVDQSKFDYHVHPKDGLLLGKQKIKAIKKVVELQVKVLERLVDHLVDQSDMVELIYFLCRHGNYGCLHQIFTQQQMKIMSISSFGYISADLFLEEVNLISFVLIKMLLFNLFFDHSTSIPSASANKLAVSNVSLVGNVLYELFVDLQDDLLQKANPTYLINNWQGLQYRLNVKIAENMTVKEGVYQKNQLISGLQMHRHVKEVYQIRNMSTQKQTLRGILQRLRRAMGKWHKRVRQSCFLE